MATIPPVTDPRFDPEYGEPANPKQKRSPWATCLIGCAVVLLILAVLAAVIAFWVARNFRGWAAEGSSILMKEMVAQSTLPEQEKGEINVQIDRIATAIRENRISRAQAKQLIENVFRSPLFTSFMVFAVERTYFDKSNLAAEEKAAGRVTLQRFVRGMIDKSIGNQGIESAMQHVTTKDQRGNSKLKQQLTDAELRAFLTAAKAAADEAGVPESPPPFDPSDEFKRIIDEALSEPGPAVDAVPMPVESAEPQANE